MVGSPVRVTVENCGPLASNHRPGWLELTVLSPRGNPPAVGRYPSTFEAIGPTVVPFW